MARRGRSKRRFGLIRTLNLMAFLPLASRAPTYGRLMLALLADARVSPGRKAVLGLAGAYLVSPLDIIPEALPILGALDDLAVIVVALDIFLEGVPRQLLDEKLEELSIDPGELDRDLERVRRLVPRPIRRVAMRIPDALDGVASLVRRSGADRRLRTWLMEGRPA